ncbi:MAG: 3-keto-5-aminohexanoate cleavage protein [Pseudomonadota bacterium]
MVSPTGARRMKADHPAIPITLDEIVNAAVACHEAGAKGLHLHVREEDGRHSIDVGRYQEAIHALKAAVPDLYVQVTSEAGGRYSPAEQREMIRTLRPRHVSVALRELLSSPEDLDEGKTLYHFARAEGIDVQHIAYSPRELTFLIDKINSGIIPGDTHLLQITIGRYGDLMESNPKDLDPFLKIISAYEGTLAFDVMLCAFGSTETRCLTYAAERGVKARVGFENSIWNSDGSVARNNAERVAEVAASISAATRC